jgi:hypothetical protein
MAYARAYFGSNQPQTLNLTLETNSNVVLLSWPVSPAPFTLQMSTNLSVANGWQSTNLQVFITNGLNCYTSAISGPASFYRLFLLQ